MLPSRSARAGGVKLHLLLPQPARVSSLSPSPQREAAQHKKNGAQQPPSQARTQQTTLASEDTAPKIAAFLYLEEVIALQRCNKATRAPLPRAGARITDRARAAASRAAFWAEACRVEADKKRALSRRTATNGGFFESCAGLLDGDGGCARLKTTGVEGTIARDVRRTLRSEPSSPRVRRAATTKRICASLWPPRRRRRAIVKA